MKTIKILFKGINYSYDRSLFHFLDKYIVGKTIKLDYKINRDDLLEINIQKAYEFSKNYLKNINFGDYDEIIFIGKSIGTVVAGMLRSNIYSNLKIRFICLTPIEQTIPYLKQTDYIVSGDKDQYLNLDIYKNMINLYPFLSIKTNANHSLETPILCETFNIQEKVIEEALNYLDTAYKDLLG